MEQAIQVFAAISFFVIGLSHLLRPNEWVTFFDDLASRGTSGAFLEGFMLLNFGAIIAAFHNVWEGPATVLTVIGWGQLLKGVVRFVFPQMALRVMRSALARGVRSFQVAGVFALSISAFLWWVRFR
jgi:uncharacterized protein YjeT (DUF2065 family)